MNFRDMKWKSCLSTELEAVTKTPHAETGSTVEAARTGEWRRPAGASMNDGGDGGT